METKLWVMETEIRNSPLISIFGCVALTDPPLS